MTDQVIISIVGAAQVVIVALIAYLTHNVKKIEIATNSMKDALVTTTAKASKAEGKLEGRAELHSEQQVKISQHEDK